MALEVVRRTGGDLALFSVGDAGPIARTATVAGLQHLVVRRRLDPQLAELNQAGALNGHVPITAIVSCVAILTAALHGYDSVAMANERSASHGNVDWDGIDVNHQFSKGIRLVDPYPARPVEEIGAGVEYFSVLLCPASELGIAKAFTHLTAYHQAFSSCNTNFRRWLRAVGPLVLRLPQVPLRLPGDGAVLRARRPAGRSSAVTCSTIDAQFEGFALLTASGGLKPFECVGEEEESRRRCGCSRRIRAGGTTAWCAGWRRRSCPGSRPTAASPRRRWRSATNTPSRRD